MSKHYRTHINSSEREGLIDLLFGSRNCERRILAFKPDLRLPWIKTNANDPALHFNHERDGGRAFCQMDFAYFHPLDGSSVLMKVVTLSGQFTWE